jgi:hypothetical protein
MEKVNLLKPDLAAEHVYLLVKNYPITLDAFRKLLPLIDNECGCEVCGGTEGGTPGDENVVDGTVICDFCAAKRHKAANTIYILYDVNERAFFAKHQFSEVRVKNCIRSTYFLSLLFNTLDLTIKDVKRIGLVELPFKQTSWDGLVSCEEMV